MEYLLENGAKVNIHDDGKSLQYVKCSWKK